MMTYVDIAKEKEQERNWAAAAMYWNAAANLERDYPRDAAHYRYQAETCLLITESGLLGDRYRARVSELTASGTEPARARDLASHEFYGAPILQMETLD